MRHNYRRLFFEVLGFSGMLQEQFLDFNFKDFACLDLINPHCFINWKNSVPAEKVGAIGKDIWFSF